MVSPVIAMRNALIFIIVASIYGCTQFEIEDHSYAFNKASESAAVRMLFLNAVRASKNYPLQFSKISSYQGGGRMSADLSPSFPFGADASKIFDFKPTLKLSSGVSQLGLTDLNTQEAQERLRRKLEYNDVKYFLEQRGDRDSGQILDIFIEAFRVDRTAYQSILAFYRGRCKEPPASDRERNLCALALEARAISEPCKTEREFSADTAGFYYLRNIPTRRCDLYAFREFTVALGIARFFLYEVHLSEAAKPAASSPNQTSTTGSIVQNYYLQQEKKDGKPKATPVFSFDDEVKLNFCSIIFSKDDARKKCFDKIRYTLAARYGKLKKPGSVNTTLLILMQALSDNYSDRERYFRCVKTRVVEENSANVAGEIDLAPFFAPPPTSGVPLVPNKSSPAGGDADEIFMTDGLAICCVKNDKIEGKCNGKDGNYSIGTINSCACFQQPLDQLYTLEAPLELVFRSPERMVRYLGELIAARTASHNPGNENGASSEDTFVVLRGAPPPDAILTVTDAEGEQFYIPGSSGTNRSMITLSLVQEVLNATFSAKDLPPVTNITVTSPQ